MDILQDRRGYWFNFKTGEYEYIETPANFENYISQLPAAQGLYKVYLQMGDESIVAATKVLKATIGEKPEV